MSSFNEFVHCGDKISITDDNYLMGHGTQLNDTKDLVANVSGFVERVSKLISVKPSYTRYIGEIGDVIVGRIIDLSNKCWRVEIQGRQSAILMLSAVNLPDNAQRRRTEQDILIMRNIFKEGDMISAEATKIMQKDNAVALHTRSNKYGKLKHGISITVPCSLIKRCKQHFHTLSSHYNINIILGNNGMIWLSPPDEFSSANVDIYQSIARLRMSILVLVQSNISIFIDTILSVYNASIRLNIDISNMLNKIILNH